MGEMKERGLRWEIVIFFEWACAVAVEAIVDIAAIESVMPSKKRLHDLSVSDDMRSPLELRWTNRAISPEGVLPVRGVQEALLGEPGEKREQVLIP